jgi:predicted helicase
MAQLAHMICDSVINTFQQKLATDNLRDLYAAFQEALLPDLKVSEFADMFAQTIVYGLFAARFNHTQKGLFCRHDAASELPSTNPFLRRLFAAIAGPDFDDEPFIGFVDELALVLALTDIEAVLADFGKAMRREDPIIHFYETFLAQYDPKLREMRGVYYTPEPVVSYIVRSVDYLLREHFDCPDGLADTATLSYASCDEDGKGRVERTPRVLILDPAMGTGTFLYHIIAHIRERYRQMGNVGMWSGYVGEHLLPRLFGFELLMAPYMMAHLKLGMQLAAIDLPVAERAAWAYDFATNDLLRIYLTNTLDEALKRSEVMFGRDISDEPNQAAKVKQGYPVMVILGNPPYSGHSANKGQWINTLLRGQDSQTGRKTANYFEVDGQLLGERNPKWLNDDYVKFIRVAQWRIEKMGYGVLAFITNHGYLDNPTFRGMRHSLMLSFDDIYVLDLHGNSKKKDRSPDGSKDENVFDIQQGVAIGIFVKRQQKAGSSDMANVYHAHLWGLREVYEMVSQRQELRGGKYHWLAERDVSTTEWKRLEPTSPFFLFKPQDNVVKAEYEQGYKVTEIFGTGNPKVDGGKKYGLGICTHNDALHIAWTEAELIDRVQKLASPLIPDRVILETLPVRESPYWNTTRERMKVRNSQWQAKIWTVYYRPFDWRKIYYEPDLMDIGRGGSSRHVMDNAKFCPRNLMVSRGYEIEAFQHVLVSNAVTVHHAATSKEGNYVFPLYLYPEMALDGRHSNLSPTFITNFSTILKMRFISDGKGDLHPPKKAQQTFGPEDIFNYMYAVFHSPTYRERYAEFLKIDFPRLPLTSNANLFRELCNLGDRLVGLHLMEKFAKIITSYPVSGNDIVEKVDYTVSADTSEQNRVWINRMQYIEGVPPEVWDFHIGGYQVCQKWLKDRKGCQLSCNDINHYQRIVAALAETITLMRKIDEVIDNHGGWPMWLC